MIPSNDEFLSIIDPIIHHPEFQKRKTFPHHGSISVYEHSLEVARASYGIAKFLGVDAEAAAIAGLLHDFYEHPWQQVVKTSFFEKHAFTHGKEASVNVKKFFPQYANDKVLDSIKVHMFPLTLNPPKYLEGWIITIVDKIVSLEVFSQIAKRERMTFTKMITKAKETLLTKILIVKSYLHL